MNQEIQTLAKRTPLDFQSDFKVFRLQYLLEDLFYHYRHLASEKGIDCFLVLPDNLKKAYKADPVKIEYILSSLLAYCVEFTQKGRVDIAAMQHKSFGTVSEIKFIIEDTGSGIKLESKAAQKQQEAKSSLQVLNSKELNKVFKMLEYIGGRIGVESSGYQNGVKFSVIIPFELAS